MTHNKNKKADEISNNLNAYFKSDITRSDNTGNNK